MRLLSRIDKYIIKKFLGTYIFSILLIISIAVVFDINERLDKFLINNVPLKAIVFDYYMNFVPYYANLFSPLFVFISVIFFTSKLADNSEIIAMLSNGMSFKRLMRPYMISAAVIAAGSFVLGSIVIPPANATRINFQNKYFKDRSVNFATGVQLRVDEGVILYMEQYDNKAQEGQNLAIDHFKDKHLVSRLIATRVEYDSAYHWKLHNYSIRRFEGNREKIITGNLLDTTINVIPRDFLVSVNDIEQMTTIDLHTYISRQRNRGLALVGGVSIIQFEIEYHKRFASIFSAFILTLIGASLSARKVKGGMGMKIGVGIGLSFTYIVFMSISSAFAVSGMVSPLVAVWIPNVTFAIIAGYLYTKAPN